MDRLYENNQLTITQLALHQSEERFRSLTQSATDSIVILNNEGKIIFWNKSAERMFGYENEEAKGNDILFILSEKDRKKYKNDIINYVQTGQSELIGSTLELEGLRKDLSPLPVEISFSSWLSGKDYYFCGIIRDISERKKAESALKRSEKEFRAIFDQAYIGIAKVSLEGSFLDVNECFCDLFGYTSEELKQISFQQILHPDDQEMNNIIRNKLLKGELNKVSLDKRYLHKNGYFIYVSVTTNLVSDEEDNPDYFVSVFDDITDRKRKEETIRDSLREKELLIKEIHHRVKNNMQVIMSYMNLYKYKVNNPAVTKALTECKNLIQTMALVHENLYKTDDFVHMDFTNYIDSLCSFFNEASENSNIEIHKSFLPITLSIDKAVTCGLIINELLTNVYKHAFPNNATGTLSIDLSLKDKKVRIGVMDNGIGLPPAFNIDNSNTFGMEMVHTLVDQLDGELETINDKGVKHILTFQIDDDLKTS